MTEKEIKGLMQKYLDGTITRGEEQLLERFDANLLSKNQDWALKSPNPPKKPNLGNSPTKHLRNPFRWVAVAASLALLLGSGYLLYGEFTGEVREAPVQELTRSTQWGQKLNLSLADGTQIRLNSGSSIKYPERFTGNNRVVELEGEAYFEVAPDPQRLFVIKLGEVRTTVLGTSFNINSYSGLDHIAVTVVSGKVRVASEHKEVHLGPNEQGQFDRKTRTMTKRKTDISTYLNWKDGILQFEDTKLTEVSKTLERWFGVQIEFENGNIGNCHITASYDNVNLEGILESIVFTKKGLGYKFLDGDSISISGSCRD